MSAKKAHEDQDVQKFSSCAVQSPDTDLLNTSSAADWKLGDTWTVDRDAGKSST